jgi:hypothetical protein
MPNKCLTPQKKTTGPSTSQDVVVSFDSAEDGPAGGYTGYVIVKLASESRRAISGAFNVTLDGTVPKCVANGIPPPTSVSPNSQYSREPHAYIALFTLHALATYFIVKLARGSCRAMLGSFNVTLDGTVPNSLHAYAP